MDPIAQAAESIRKGELVIFPTETVYGIGADATNPEAVTKIYAAKRRPADNPLIIHVSSIEQVKDVAIDVPEAAYKLMQKFWPGPLTIVLPRNENIPLETTAGMDSVAVRMPDHTIALELIKLSGKPIAAPSANISGRPSATRFQDIDPELAAQVSIVLDGGDSKVGLESTIVDMRTGEPKILRSGAITLAQINEVVSNEMMSRDVEEFHAPGSRYKHYSPDVEIRLIPTSENELTEIVEAIKSEQGKKVGAIVTSEYISQIPDGVRIFNIGSNQNLETVAANLFKVLNELRNSDLDIVISQSFPETDIGIAIMDRLSKAATK